MKVEFERAWAMPNKNTFQIPPIRDFILRELPRDGVVIDPFANSSKIATITNDIDPQYGTDYNMDALDFLGTFKTESVDMILFDPPFTKRQLVETYKRLGKSVNMETTQQRYWTDIKKEISRILVPGGKVISCGFSSGGIGKDNGFSITRIMLVAHGGGHNDTIVVLDEKIQCKLTGFPRESQIIGVVDRE